jgi:hypothetical protein
MLDFEHVHLGLAPDKFRRCGLLILADPIFRIAQKEDTGLRKGQSYLSGHLFPKDHLVDEVEKGLLVMQGVVGL